MEMMSKYSIELLKIFEDIKNQRKIELERFKCLNTEERVIALNLLEKESRQNKALLHEMKNKNSLEHGVG